MFVPTQDQHVPYAPVPVESMDHKPGDYVKIMNYDLEKLEKELKNKTIDPNALCEDDDLYVGYSALSMLASTFVNDSFEKVKLLVKYGADVNYVSPRGRSVLSYAVESTRSGCLEILEFLLQSGAEVNRLDKQGHSELMGAILLKQEEYKPLEESIKDEESGLKVIQLLLNYGAKIDLENPTGGETLMDWMEKEKVEDSKIGHFRDIENVRVEDPKILDLLETELKSTKRMSLCMSAFSFYR